MTLPLDFSCLSRNKTQKTLEFNWWQSFWSSRKVKVGLDSLRLFILNCRFKPAVKSTSSVNIGWAFVPFWQKHKPRLTLSNPTEIISSCSFKTYFGKKAQNAAKPHLNFESSLIFDDHSAPSLQASSTAGRQGQQEAGRGPTPLKQTSWVSLPNKGK